MGPEPRSSTIFAWPVWNSHILFQSGTNWAGGRRNGSNTRQEPLDGQHGKRIRSTVGFMLKWAQRVALLTVCIHNHFLDFCKPVCPETGFKHVVQVGRHLLRVLSPTTWNLHLPNVVYLKGLPQCAGRAIGHESNPQNSKKSIRDTSTCCLSWLTITCILGFGSIASTPPNGKRLLPVQNSKSRDLPSGNKGTSAGHGHMTSGSVTIFVSQTAASGLT